HLELSLPHQAHHTYQVRVVVSDGHASDSAAGSDTARNLKPVAKLNKGEAAPHAEASLSGNPCIANPDVITANASASCDADLDPLTYQWYVDDQPVGGNTSTLNVSLPHKAHHVYMVKVVVDDGQSAPEGSTDQ